MTREWKPGDVAVAARANGAECRALLRHDGTWRLSDAGESPPLRFRPLVIIDPEDHEQVKRLTRLLGGHSFFPEVRTALREFANPTPPKPDEPTGLGAVIEDADDEKWVRLVAEDDGPSDDWARMGALPSDGKWTFYADITTVRVLSEGVS